MARYVHRDGDFTVLEVSWPEVAHLIKDLVNMMVYGRGPAPGLQIENGGGRLLFQFKPKREDPSVISPPHEG